MIKKFLDGIDRDAYMASILANQEKWLKKNASDDELGMGEPTEMKCSCGGVLHRFDPTRAQFVRLQREMGNPRFSRRRRQMKKNHKKWRESQGFKAYILTALARPLRNPMGFRCATCGKQEGFYSSIAKNIFKIEPLPQGALPTYDKESR